MQGAEDHTRIRYEAPPLDPAVRPNLPDDMILRRYRVMGSCGTGGFGTVLACWDTRLQRRVAIKRMRLAPNVAAVPEGATAPTQAVAATMGEALGEARTASRLEHPGIVQVHDFAVENGIAYLVMEYVDGLTLADLLSRVEGGTLTHDEGAYLAQQLGAAIDFAHRAGVLHLDIKPSNIMFSRDGKVKLCDFGMATLASATGYADARGGTVGYMPPEQVEGDMVDERTDVFALAVVVTQALTGTNPFAAPTAEKSAALVRRGLKPKLSKLDPALAGMAEQTLSSCMSSDPANRPSDIAIVADDLAYSLGIPEDGAASIKTLLSQLDGADEADEPQWEGERLPFSYRYPWLYPALKRVATAVVCGVVAYQLTPFVPIANQVPAAAAGLAIAAASVLWAPSGSALAVAAIVAALIAAETSMASVCLALGLALVLGTWWLVHLPDRSASLCLLAASAVGQPAAASAIAAAEGVTPLSAGVTALLGWSLATLLRPLIDASFVFSAANQQLGALLTLPSLVRAAGCAAGAATGALFTRSWYSPSRLVAGQCVCCVVVIVCQLLAGRMENGGIWPSPSWETVGVAVMLGAIVSLAVGLCGPRDGDEDDKEPR